MARLGELLVAAGLVTADQVEQALRAQVMWGGRIGTNLIELGHLELDDLARMLGRQHRLPAALSRHFERSDRALQLLLSSAVAERHAVVPLFRAGKLKDRIAIVSRAPLPRDVLAELGDALGVPADRLVQAIAAELRIAYHLERAYQIPRDLRFLRPRNKTVPAFLHFEVFPVPVGSEPDLVLSTDSQDLPAYRPSAQIPVVIEPEPQEPALGLGDDDSTPPPSRFDDTAVEPEDTWDHERRRYVRTITDELTVETEAQVLGRIALRRIAVAGAPGAAGATLEEAVRAIRRSHDRDQVADLVLDALERFVPVCEAAILLVKRGDVAISWKGFSRCGTALLEIAVPLGPPAPGSLVSLAIDTESAVRAQAGDLGSLDLLLRRSLGDAGGELAIVPISISGQVMCAIALIVQAGSPIEPAESLAAAAGAAFARLMRAASR
jgi:hypothetical protein